MQLVYLFKQLESQKLEVFKPDIKINACQTAEFKDMSASFDLYAMFFIYICINGRMSAHQKQSKEVEMPEAHATVACLNVLANLQGCLQVTKIWTSYQDR
jgi:hypothetical protein